MLERPRRGGAPVSETSLSILEQFEADHRTDVDFLAQRLALSLTEQAARIMTQKSVSRAELAGRLGVSRGYVTRTFNAPPNLTLRTIAGLALALGTEVSINFAAASDLRSQVVFPFVDAKGHPDTMRPQLIVTTVGSAKGSSFAHDPSNTVGWPASHLVASLTSDYVAKVQANNPGFGGGSAFFDALSAATSAFTSAIPSGATSALTSASPLAGISTVTSAPAVPESSLPSRTETYRAPNLAA